MLRVLCSTIATCGLVAVAVCMTAGTLRADDLAELRAANKSSYEAIQTLTCRVKRSVRSRDGDPYTVAVAKYWYADGASRVQAEANGEFRDSVIRNSTLTVIIRGVDRAGKPTLRYFHSKASENEPNSPYDPWALGLLRLCGPFGKPLSLDDLLARKHRLLGVERTRLDEREVVVVKLRTNLGGTTSGDFEFAFDPAVNYLACKLVGIPTPGMEGDLQTTRESTVLRFSEVTPGLFFPELSETVFKKEGELPFQVHAELLDVRINQPVDPQTFVLEIPPNAEVLDSIKNEVYRVDASGKPVGERRTLATVTPLLRAPLEVRETREEPRSMFPHVLVFVSGLILLVAGGVWIWRKHRENLAS